MQYYVDEDVVIGDNVVIEPFAIVKSGSVLMDNVLIGSGSVIEASVIGCGSVVHNSRIVDSKVGEHSTVGPYAHIRSNSVVGSHCRIGNFVEIKNSTLGDYTKASHLAYIGDATIGEHCNIGCGVIFVNYDGRRKHRSVVGDYVFVGCNSNIISPVSIGDYVFVACGATVNTDLYQHDFAIGRSQLTVKKDYSAKYIDRVDSANNN